MLLLGIILCSICLPLWKTPLARAYEKPAELEMGGNPVGGSQRVAETGFEERLTSAGRDLKRASTFFFGQWAVGILGGRLSSELGLDETGALVSLLSSGASMYLNVRAYRSIGDAGSELVKAGSQPTEVCERYGIPSVLLKDGGDYLQRAKGMGYKGIWLSLAGMASMTAAAYFAEDDDTVALLAAAGALGSLGGAAICSLLADGHVGSAGDELCRIDRSAGYPLSLVHESGSNLRTYRKLQYAGKGLVLAGGVLIIAAISGDDALSGGLALGGVGAILGGAGCLVAAPVFLYRAGERFERAGAMMGIR